MAPNRNYESLVAGMRERPTIFDAEDVLKKDYKVRFPDRRAITLWNTPELSQFRGVQEAHDEMEERVHNAQLEQMELRRAAASSETSMPDMEFVAAEVMRSRQSEGALRDAMAGQAAAHAQQLRGMQEETSAQMSRLATEAAAASKRAELADRALEGLRDMHAEHRAALGQIAERMGRPQPVQIDQSVTNYNTQHVTAVDERSIHNVAMQMLNHGAAQFGAAMAQNRQSQEQMMQSLMDYAATHQQQHNHIHFSIATPPNEPVEMQVVSSGPPPPPPGAGAIRRGRPRTRQTPYDDAPMPPRPPPPPPAPPPAPALPAPAPEAPPTAPAAIVRYTSQPRPRRERTRSAPRAKARPSAAPVPTVPSPLLPTPEPAVPKPSVAGELQMEDVAAPSAAPAKPTRARAKPSARPIKPSTARPNPAPIMWTTGPAPEEAMPPKRARKEGKGKGAGAAPKAAPKSKGRGGGRVNAAAVAAAVGKDEEKPAVPKPKSAPRRNKVPAAGPPIKKTIVKKVPLDEGGKEGTLKLPRRNKGKIMSA